MSIHHADGRREGERLRDEALARLAAWRAVHVRRFCRAWLRHLIDHGPDTSDAGRHLVTIPAGTDPRLVGAAVRALSVTGVIRRVDRRQSRRALAHGRTMDVWAVRDVTTAEMWLRANPELSDPGADTGSPTPTTPTLPPGDLFAAANPDSGEV